MRPSYIQSLNRGEKSVRTQYTWCDHIKMKSCANMYSSFKRNWASDPVPDMDNILRKQSLKKQKKKKRGRLKLGHPFNLRDLHNNLDSLRISWYVCGRQIHSWVLLDQFYGKHEKRKQVAGMKTKVTFGNFYREMGLKILELL